MQQQAQPKELEHRPLLLPRIGDRTLLVSFTGCSTAEQDVGAAKRAASCSRIQRHLIAGPRGCAEMRSHLPFWPSLDAILPADQAARSQSQHESAGLPHSKCRASSDREWRGWNSSIENGPLPFPTDPEDQIRSRATFLPRGARRFRARVVCSDTWFLIACPVWPSLWPKQKQKKHGKKRPHRPYKT